MKETSIAQTQVCKCCGRELPLEMFRVSKLGRYQTCQECTRKHQIQAKAEKKAAQQKQVDVENARSLRLMDFTPRELMVELKRRGYEGKLTYTETRVVDFTSL